MNRIKALSPAAVVGLALSLVVLTAAASAANKPRPAPKHPAPCRIAKTGAYANCDSSTSTTAKKTTTTSKPGTTTTTAAKPKPAPAKTTTTTQHDQWPYDGNYSGTVTIHVHETTTGPAAPPPDINETVPISFVVAHGVASFYGGGHQITNGQTSVVTTLPGFGTFGGTVDFVLTGNGSVQVDGQLQGQLSAGGAVVNSSGVIKASRISR